ncbi:hypothetical protein O181_129382 [Austropuccinia psidii MF-1]|uniref:Uncharacterized protein n=1 Tax=Austropuccinia psidii MF-1 TaxID=1389203 RepID=A0A9Q3L1Q5_9BASI|nr:hypothetical protein [Austropuccinia psidii MF-1]
MEDSRTSTSSQRLASNFDTLMESPEADITAIAVRPKSLPTGSSRDIPVIRRRSCPRQGQHPSGSSPSIHQQKSALTSAKKAQANPKYQSEGQEKGKGKGKAQVEQALPSELQNTQEREDSHRQCVHYRKNSYGIQKKGRGKLEQIFSKEIDLVKLLTQLESCNKEIMTKLKTFEYIQQKLGNEILKVKETQKIIVGLENVNKDNILSLAQICARIESKFTLLNQPDDNSISFITRQLKELRIQVQNLENSTGLNAALFQEQLEESDKERL